MPNSQVRHNRGSGSVDRRDITKIVLSGLRAKRWLDDIYPTVLLAVLSFSENRRFLVYGRR